MTITFTERYEGVEDRTGWPAGPWDDEPDKVVWIDGATGLDCMARRGGGGAWCGYVGLPASHPWHSVSYHDHLDVPCTEFDRGDMCFSHSPDCLIDVHGGITYAAACREDGRPEADICHLSDDGPVWWFGFDCSHWQDLRPGSLALEGRLGLTAAEGTYRTLDYVIRQTQRLAAQLAGVAS